MLGDLLLQPDLERLQIDPAAMADFYARDPPGKAKVGDGLGRKVEIFPGLFARKPALFDSQSRPLVGGEKLGFGNVKKGGEKSPGFGRRRAEPIFIFTKPTTVDPDSLGDLTLKQAALDPGNFESGSDTLSFSVCSGS
jgi:hypothetical protein